MNYCSHCAAPLEYRIPSDDNLPRYICPACGMIHYENPKIVVGCIPEWQDRVLMCLRDIEPRKGFWTLPAGFLENGETVMDGARRETYEETGAAVESVAPYLMFDIVHIGQIYVMFRCRLAEPRFHTTPESAQVQLFREDEVPWEAIAFTVIEQTLSRFFKDRAKGKFPFQIDQIKSR
jgi:ADP-ribose pyrophosphatase YjhB (NUDIX family)